MNPYNNPFIDFVDLNQEIEQGHLSDLIDFYLCDGCGLLYEVNASDGIASYFFIMGVMAREMRSRSA
jgi:hypothetical protein